MVFGVGIGEVGSCDLPDALVGMVTSGLVVVSGRYYYRRSGGVYILCRLSP